MIKRRTALMFSLAVLLYLILMLVSAPAWLLGLFAGPAVQAGQYQGSLWQGEARQLQLGRQQFDRLHWQWLFPFSWQVQGESEQLRFSTVLKPGVAEHRLTQLNADIAMQGQPVATLTGSLIRFTANQCLQADNLHWQLTDSLRQLLAGQADTDGLLYCDEGNFNLDADALRLAIGLENYRPIVRTRWVAPQYRALLGGF